MSLIKELTNEAIADKGVQWEMLIGNSKTKRFRAKNAAEAAAIARKAGAISVVRLSLNFKPIGQPIRLKEDFDSSNTTNEDVTPAAGIIIFHHQDGGSYYEIASSILKKFGYKDIGSVEDFSNDLQEFDVAWEDLPNPDNMSVFYTRDIRGDKKLLEQLFYKLERSDYVSAED